MFQRRLSDYPACIAIFLINAAFMVQTGFSEAPHGQEGVDALIAAGAVRPDLLWAGDWWRLITAGFVHIGLTHFLLNMFGLVFLGSLAERALGSAKFLILYVMAGIVGFGLSQTFHPVNVVSAGASASLFGILGMLIADDMLRGRSVIEFLHSMRGRLLVVYAAFLFLMGLSQQGIDNWAHAGGFIGGFLACFFIIGVRWRLALRGQRLCAVAVGLILFEIVAYPVFPVANDQWHTALAVEALSDHDYARAERELDLSEKIGTLDSAAAYYQGLLEGKRLHYGRAFELVAMSDQLHLAEMRRYHRPAVPNFAAFVRQVLFARLDGEEAGSLMRIDISDLDNPAHYIAGQAWAAILSQNLREVEYFERSLGAAASEIDASGYFLGTRGACRALLGEDGADEDLASAIALLDREARDHRLEISVVLQAPPFMFQSDLKPLLMAMRALIAARAGNLQSARGLLVSALEIDSLCEARSMVEEAIR